MLPTISQVCTLHSTFEQDLEAYSAAKCTAIEIWFTKLETYLKRYSLDDVRRLRDKCEVLFPVASYQGGLWTTQPDRRAVAWELFRQRLQLCRELEIATVVVAADISAPLTSEVLDRIGGTLAEMSAEAGQHGCRIALEFQAHAAFCNNLETAAAMVEQVGHPQLGICLDAFHFFIGPSKSEDLGYARQDNLFHVQLCDVSSVPRELASDSDRILPGDGDFMLSMLVEHLRRIDYTRSVSLELFNPQIWQIPALQVGEIGITAVRKLIGLTQQP